MSLQAKYFNYLICWICGVSKIHGIVHTSLFYPTVINGFEYAKRLMKYVHKQPTMTFSQPFIDGHEDKCFTLQQNVWLSQSQLFIFVHSCSHTLPDVWQIDSLIYNLEIFHSLHLVLC